MRNIGEVREIFQQHNIGRVKLGAFDIDATLRGKYVGLERFLVGRRIRTGVLRCGFGWNIGDVLYDNAQFTGWHTGYPDAHCRIDLESLRVIPWEPGTAFFLMDFVSAEGAPLAIAPRQVFAGVLAKAEQAGYHPYFSAEYEIFFAKRHTASGKNISGI